MSTERLNTIKGLIEQEIAEGGTIQTGNCATERRALKKVSDANKSLLSELDFINEFAEGVTLTNGRNLTELLGRVKTQADTVRITSSPWADSDVIDGDTDIPPDVKGPVLGGK